MEQETQSTEQVTETDKTVSTDETQTETTETQEWSAPSTKEELDTLLQASSNKAKTSLLKELGVNSIKEFKQAQSQLEKEKANIDTLTTEKETALKTVEELTGKYTNLVQDNTLNKLNVSQDWKKEITEQALKQVTDDKPFEAVVAEMTAGKWSHAVENKAPFRMGSEKKSISEKERYQSEMERLRNL